MSTTPNIQSDREVREKLTSRGVRSMSDAELLSIILQEGDTKKSMSALEFAQNILAGVGGSLQKLSSKSMSSLRMTEGLGVKRAALIMSTLELGRRAANEIAQTTNVKVIKNSEDVITLFRPLIASLPYEEFWALYLNAANGILDKIRVSQGGVSSTVVDHKIIVKRAVELLASGIILVHNHPSGFAQPSEEDIELTKNIAIAASLFEINLVDHLIITTTESLSFKHLGLI